MKAVETQKETVVFGGGCFWCTEAVFQMLEGIVSVRPGYAGGEKAQPTYEEVCNGNTGHAEVIEVIYNPAVISFGDLLSVFFNVHDPTQTNGQGNDIGTQYRSVIYYSTRAQQKEADELLQEFKAKKAYDKPVVTEVKPLNMFFPAEAYHRDYYKRNSDVPYCELIIAPKLEKLQRRFAALLRHE